MKTVVSGVKFSTVPPHNSDATQTSNKRKFSIWKNRVGSKLNPVAMTFFSSQTIFPRSRRLDVVPRRSLPSLTSPTTGQRRRRRGSEERVGDCTAVAIGHRLISSAIWRQQRRQRRRQKTGFGFTRSTCTETSSSRCNQLRQVRLRHACQK